jgi:hypothetical protein
MTGADAVPAGGGKRIPRPRAATGLHSQALRPAARSWLTGVAGPRSESVARTPCNDTAVARREAPFDSGRASSARHALGIGGRKKVQGKGRLTRGRSNNTGDFP